MNINDCLSDRRLGLWGWFCETQHFLLLLVRMTSQKSSLNIGVDGWKVGLIRLIIKVRDTSIPQHCFWHHLDAAQSEMSVWIGRLGPPGWIQLLFVKTAHLSPERSRLYSGVPPPRESASLLFIYPSSSSWEGDVMHGYRRNNCPEVARGGLVCT